MNKQTPNEASSAFGQPGPAGKKSRVVYIVDDDPAMRHALSLLLEGANYAVRSFTTAGALLSAVDEKSRGILILDLFLPDMSGLSLQDELRNRGIGLKTIFISGYGGINESVLAIKGGAIDFIEKPFTNEQVLNSVEEALSLASAEEKWRRTRDSLEKRYELLTPREREIIQFLVRGDSSRKLAERLGLSSRTIEIHRAKIMRKLEASSLPDLVRMVYMSSNSRPEEVLIDIRQTLQLQENQSA